MVHNEHEESQNTRRCDPARMTRSDGLRVSIMDFVTGKNDFLIGMLWIRKLG